MDMLVTIVFIRIGLWLHLLGSARSRSAGAVLGRSMVESASVVVVAYAAIVVGHLSEPQAIGRSLMAAVMLAWVAVTVVNGAMAERSRFMAQALVAVLLTACVGVSYSVGFAGIQPAMVAAAWLAAAALCAILCARILGPRIGKYNRDGSANMIPGHHLPAQIIGLGILSLVIPVEFGHPHAGLLASAAATVGSAVYLTFRFGKVDMTLTATSALAGAVAGATFGEAYAMLPALGLGLLAGVFSPMLGIYFDLVGRVDDTAGLATPVLTGSALGLIGAGVLVFMNGASVAVAGWLVLILAPTGTAGLLLVLLYVLRLRNLLRESQLDETEGLDLSRHDVNAYPDFQQTVIKSYHLRQ